MSTPTHNLFGLPLLRRQVYTEVQAPKLKLHLFPEDGRPRVSPCLGAHLGDNEYNSRQVTDEERARLENPDSGLRECGSFGPHSESTRRCLHRLQSSWGPHYKCEEVPKGMWLSDNHPGMQRHNYITLLWSAGRCNAVHPSLGTSVPPFAGWIVLTSR